MNASHRLRTCDAGGEQPSNAPSDGILRRETTVQRSDDAATQTLLSLQTLLQRSLERRVRTHLHVEGVGKSGSE